MVMAVHYARLGNRKMLVVFLLSTAVLGAVFLALKGYEYYTDYQEYLIPGLRFNRSEWIVREGLAAADVPKVELFLLFYWIMTPIHALHLSIGIVIVLVLATMASRRQNLAIVCTPVDIVGLYWHFVDIVWIFLLPMLYLLGTHKWSS